MINFFKNFGKGILYVLVLPFLLVGMAVYGVFAFFVFIFLSIKGLVLFFTGRSLYEDLPEDIEAKKILSANKNQPEENRPINTTIISPTDTPNEPVANPINADPFYVPEYLKGEEEEVNEETNEPVIEEEIEKEPEVNQIEEEPEVQTSEINIQEDTNDFPDDDIIIEKSTQNKTIFEIPDDEDEEDSGVNIDFE